MSCNMIIFNPSCKMQKLLIIHFTLTSDLCNLHLPKVFSFQEGDRKCKTVAENSMLILTLDVHFM